MGVLSGGWGEGCTIKNRHAMEVRHKENLSRFPYLYTISSLIVYRN
jgi:hypothetical protein